MQTENINSIFIIFFSIALLVVFALVFLFVQFNGRKNQLIREQLEQKLQNQHKQHQLELRALRSQLNPHFVHNSLNAIQYYIQQNEVEISENYLTKFSKLMRAFFEYSRESTISLAEELDLIRTYLEIEQLRFEDKLNFEFFIDKGVDIEMLQIPTMLLQPIVENAINHGIFHQSDGGTVNVRILHVDAVTYEVIIEDDGIGINQSIIKKHRKKKKLSSSQVLDERISLLNQSKEWEIDFTIKDRSDISNENGTVVSLRIKHNENE